jgi:hypothetical protein
MSLICRAVFLLVAVGLASSSFILLTVLSTEGDSHESQQPVVEEIPPLTIFVSVASYRDVECQLTMQVHSTLLTALAVFSAYQPLH